MSCLTVCAQTPIVLMDKTFKLKANSTEEIYFSFAAGDQIVIDFAESNDKPIKQIEVIEQPSSTKFSSINISSLTAKTIYVHRKGVYLFKLTSPALAARECHITISRIPQSSATANFNTNWKWVTKYDTTWTSYKEDSLVGYDKIPYTETVREVVSRELRPEQVVDRNIVVHSRTNLDYSPKASVAITLPQNKISHNQEDIVVSWAYYISVGDNSNNFFSRNKSSIQNLTGKATKIITTNALVGYAANLITGLAIPNPEDQEDVVFAIVPNAWNKNNFMQGIGYQYLKRGNIKSDYYKFTDNNLQGEYYLCLYNDNNFRKIDVYVQVVAIIETTVYQDVQYERWKTQPRYVTLNKRRMSVSSTQVRVPVE